MRLKLLKFTPFITPILTAIFPILSFYVHNISDLSPKFLGKPLIYSIVFSMLSTLIIYWFTKNREKSALIATGVIFIFFSYGHLSQYLNNKIFIPISSNLVLGPDKFLFPLALVSIFLLTIKIIRSQKNFSALLTSINLTLGLLVSWLVLVVIITNRSYLAQLNILQSVLTENRQTSPKDTPDIYHIILDGYARADVLESIYGYDNSNFIKELQDLGFYVADKAHANYLHTHLSLSSTLNLEYLDFLPQKFGKKPANTSPALNLSLSNLVTKKLKEYGYTTINFVSGWGGTSENYQADINYTSDVYTFKIAGLNLILDEATITFLQTTLIHPFIRQIQEDARRARIIITLQKLPTMPYRSEKKFVLAHLVIPHPPYLFTADGQPAKGPESADEGIETRPYYLEQLKFISKEIVPILQKLINNSQKPPIIILQSDHGPASILGKRENWDQNYNQLGLKERSGILYAIFFPDKDYGGFYNDLTPVNTYRIIFNKYFGENWEILPDKTYYTTYDEYDFKDITEAIK